MGELLTSSGDRFKVSFIVETDEGTLEIEGGLARMFEDQTFEEIMGRMLSHNSADIETREGSVIYNALAPAAGLERTADTKAVRAGEFTSGVKIPVGSRFFVDHLYFQYTAEGTLECETDGKAANTNISGQNLFVARYDTRTSKSDGERD